MGHREIKYEGKKINKLCLACFGRTVQNAWGPTGSCLVGMCGEKLGIWSREGVTRLQENRTNWHRPRRRRAAWCSPRTLCNNSHQSYGTAASRNNGQTYMHTCIVCKHECIDAHRRGFTVIYHYLSP